MRSAGRCPRSTTARHRRSCAARSRARMTRTHDIIRANFDRSPLFAGAIEGRGPRYCPSIEDKVKRFADRDAHQIFLEPEGLDDPLVYPNGISTSLPADVQAEFVRSHQGLERAVIARPGYAVEYEFVDPRRLSQTLGMRELPGLFLAGQINGTTGYEEAAAQGLAAGLNAAASARDLAEVRFDRRTSYIGVMIDDLTLQGVSEPYRMMTARAEHRLLCAPTMRPPASGWMRWKPIASRSGGAARSAITCGRARARDGPRPAREDEAFTRPISRGSSANGKSCGATPAPGFPPTWIMRQSPACRPRWSSDSAP